MTKMIKQRTTNNHPNQKARRRLPATAAVAAVQWEATLRAGALWAVTRSIMSVATTATVDLVVLSAATLLMTTKANISEKEAAVSRLTTTAIPLLPPTTVALLPLLPLPSITPPFRRHTPRT